MTNEFCEHNVLISSPCSQCGTARNPLVKITLEDYANLQKEIDRRDALIQKLVERIECSVCVNCEEGNHNICEGGKFAGKCDCKESEEALAEARKFQEGK